MVVAKLLDPSVAASPKAPVSAAANSSCSELALAIVDAGSAAGLADVTSKVADLASPDAVVLGPDVAGHTVMDALGSSEDTDSHTYPEAFAAEADRTSVVHAGHDSAETPLMRENSIAGYGRWVGKVAACVRLPLIPASLDFTRQFQSRRAVMVVFPNLMGWLGLT